MISFKKQTSTNGIEKCHPTELPAEFYSLTNKWSGFVAGQHLTVYAGCLTHNQAKGVLVLRALPADTRRISGKHCSVPQDGGSLAIVESRGSRLRIAMAKGGSFWFDIPQGVRKAA